MAIRTNDCNNLELQFKLQRWPMNNDQDENDKDENEDGIIERRRRRN